MCIFTSAIVTIVAITGTAIVGAIPTAGMSVGTIMPARFITTHRHPRHVLWSSNPRSRFMLSLPDHAVRGLARDGAAGAIMAAARAGKPGGR
ncbi:hypothetical protein OI70_12530 [Dickeya fangzhongdai]|nr:hypothetical protein OI70_12530 [Dickeya fangzhongdai]